MPLLVPRLCVSDETATVLRNLANERGVSLGEVVARLVEEGVTGRRIEAAASDRETLFRILLAGEKAGLKVVGASEYPADWRFHGGLSPDVCREVAASFEAWKRGQDEYAGSRKAATGGP